MAVNYLMNTALLAGAFLFQPFFQCGRRQLREPDPGKAVLRGEDEGLGQLVAGDHLSVFLRPAEKLPGPLGGGGVVQVENAHDAPVPDGKVPADG